VGAKASAQPETSQHIWSSAWLAHHLAALAPPGSAPACGSGRSENAVLYFVLTETTSKVQQSLTSSGCRG